MLEKYFLLEAMNTIIKSMNDVGAYMEWIYIVPDQATREELEYMCKDENKDLYKEAVELFNELIKQYSKSGYYVDGKLF